jgi:hypothetical protein
MCGRVPQSSYIEALTSKRYLMWAAEAASSRIADIDEGPDGHDRLVLVTAYGGEIHDYGNRIEIPERTSDGHRVEDLANADAIYKTLAVLAARLAIVKGWTRAEISPQNSAFFVRAFESLVSAGVQLPSKGHAKSDGDVIKAASEWHRPHWNRVQITDKQRHDWLGALVGKMPEPGRRSRDPIPYKADGGHGVAQPTPKGRGAGSGTTGDQNAPARGGIPVGREQLVADAKDALDIGAAAPDQWLRQRPCVPTMLITEAEPSDKVVM